MYLKSHAAPAQFKANFEQRIVEGYASIFGNVDEVNDVMVPGAFKKTLAERLPAKLLKSCYNHGPLIGSLQPGTAEDSVGLFTRIKVSNSPLGTAVLQDIVDDHLTHMSFMYDPIRREYIQTEDANKAAIRRLLEVKLFEAGPVDFPANEMAGILGAKQLAEALEEAAAAIPKLAELWKKKGLFKDSELDLNRQLTGAIASAIESAIQALSERQPEPDASASVATTPQVEPPPNPSSDPEAEAYEAIEQSLAALRLDMALIDLHGAAAP